MRNRKNEKQKKWEIEKMRNRKKDRCKDRGI